MESIGKKLTRFSGSKKLPVMGTTVSINDLQHSRMDDYSDLLKDSAESLGTVGYCDIAAEVLLESFPDAQLYRVTDNTGSRFAHVFLVVDGSALDIKGFQTIEEIVASHGGEGFQAEPVTMMAVHIAFRGHGRTPEEREIVRRRFLDHIEENPEIFSRDA